MCQFAACQPGDFIRFSSIYPSNLGGQPHSTLLLQITESYLFCLLKQHSHPPAGLPSPDQGARIMRCLLAGLPSSTRSISNLFPCCCQVILLKYRSKPPWWRSGQESACQCRGHGFEPWSGKIPHATEQLSPCTTTTEPACHNY